MAQFGAQIYVANMIGLIMVRELGPLLAAILLAGRSGSAFAAEIGTMKVNEELNALETFGLNPDKVSGLPACWWPQSGIPTKIPTKCRDWMPQAFVQIKADLLRGDVDGLRLFPIGFLPKLQIPRPKFAISGHISHETSAAICFRVATEPKE